LENIDQQLFFFVNHNLHIKSLDTLMPFWRSQYFWLPLYAFFISYLFINFSRKNAVLYLLALGLTVGTADMVSSRLVKKTVQRLRPCNDERLSEQVKLLVPCGSGYSFTSSHAANHFAAAAFVLMTFVSTWQKKQRLGWILLLFWASSIAFGQVYVGVHYPTDVVAGGILGWLIGRFGAGLYNRFAKNLFINDAQQAIMA
jgi:membrane-associated phospholipid phosphatase